MENGRITFDRPAAHRPVADRITESIVRIMVASGIGALILVFVGIIVIAS